MSDWLTEHEDSAASMNSAIQKNAEDIVTANTNITKNTTDIATANTAIQKNKTDIETANSVIQQNKTDISTANTNIQKNVDDITALKNDVAINKSTLGVQCKNLLPNNIKSRNWNGVEVTKYDDGSVNLNGTMTASSTVFLQIGKINADILLNKKIVVSGINTVYQIDGRDNDDKQIFVYTKNGNFELQITNQNLSFMRIMIQAASNTVYDNVIFHPMVRYAEITDDTYEPYMPSIQSQINTLLARIEALEGTVNTTEGGE
jgi:hypothetical protein